MLALTPGGGGVAARQRSSPALGRRGVPRRISPNTSVAEASHLAAERLRQAITNHRIDEVGQITASFRVAQYAPRTGTAASATAICCAASCSRPRSSAASRKARWVVRGFAVDASLIKADTNKQRSVFSGRREICRLNPEVVNLPRTAQSAAGRRLPSRHPDLRVNSALRYLLAMDRRSFPMSGRQRPRCRVASSAATLRTLPERS